MKSLSGWGRYPRVAGEVHTPLTRSQCSHHIGEGGAVIARGLGRSYGDSALAGSVLSLVGMDNLVAFDAQAGRLTCEAGTSLESVLQFAIPRGWFPAVTPGTRFVTVGGAIASDVHGKNHHGDGTFGAHVLSLDLALGNGEVVHVSPTENAELFHATCGGMGLTGVILSATLQLRPVRASAILQTSVRAGNLDALVDAFEAHRAATYSVAWIDCMTTGANLGRGVLMLGEHCTDGPLDASSPGPRVVPMDLPRSALNPLVARTFNGFYYRHTQADAKRVGWQRFFYPLDGLSHWNRLYGRDGFLQYQFVLPQAAGVLALRQVLDRIAGSGHPSFLAVLKQFGPSNSNLLSFPAEGYTLALDFKVDAGVFSLLDELDAVVLDHGGRHYLAKDARMTQATFRRGYPRWEEFEQVRARWHAHGRFASAQSRRLGLQ